MFTAIDFTRFWDPIDTTEDVRRFGGRLIIPSLIIDTEDVMLDDQNRLCLTEPIVFMRAEGLEVVHEIPAGTCLEDNGRTEFVVSE